MKNRNFITALSLIALLGLAACGSEDSSNAPVNQGEQEGQNSVEGETSVPGDNTVPVVEENEDPALYGGKLSWKYLNPNIPYGEFVDERDGQVYKTVQIGDQVWMAENLNLPRLFRFELKDGSVVFAADEMTEQVCGGDFYDPNSNCRKKGGAGGSDVCYLDNNKNCAKFGRLYKVDEVSCPTGWHLPSINEFETMLKSVLGSEDYPLNANSLAAVGFGGGSSTNASGLSVVPSGYMFNGYFHGNFEHERWEYEDLDIVYRESYSREFYGGWSIEGRRAGFWTATKNDYGGGGAYYFSFTFNEHDVYINDSRNAGTDCELSVRCIKD